MQCLDIYPIKRNWPYVEFMTSDFSYITYFVSLYNDGYISNKHIWYCKKSRNLFVILYEPDEFCYCRDKEYFLVLEPFSNTMEIKSSYDISRYVPQRYLQLLESSLQELIQYF